MEKARAIVFTLAFLLLMSKKRGQEKLFLVLTMPKAPSTELGTSKHA
jgi:hypothetical protein